MWKRNLDLVVCEFSSLVDERDSSSLTFSVELVLVLLLILRIFNLDFFSFSCESEDSPWTAASNWRFPLSSILALLLNVVLLFPEGFSFREIIIVSSLRLFLRLPRCRGSRTSYIDVIRRRPLRRAG